MAKLFVIAGHGAGDPGACANGYSEAERVRALASRLKALGGSSVQVGDTGVNWYASNYISKGRCPKGVPVIELHMDSAAASAKGGHVIIKAGIGGADEYDKALASFIRGMFPGRSITISERSDLANPNRAYAMGVNYRLLECCFITNSGDLGKFNAKTDDLARGILEAFGIEAGKAEAKPEEKPEANASIDSSVLGNLDYWGPKFTKALQAQLGTVQDGIISYQPKSNAKYLPNVEESTIQYTSSYKQGSQMVRALQKKVGATVDGWLGKETVKKLQSWLASREYSVGSSGSDGSCGPATCRALGKALNAKAFK